MQASEHIEPMRLDKLLIQKNLVSSRTRAEEIISSGFVMVNGLVIDKPSKKITPDSSIQLLEQELPYVSRGALKLLGAFEKWPLRIKGQICLDIGASTGGFTQVMLEKGASKVYALDVGHGQLHETIAADERVINMEKVNFRHAGKELISDTIQFCAIDVSFISLEHILPPLCQFLHAGAYIYVLVKPQFEVGKEAIGKGGIVRDETHRKASLEKIKEFSGSLGFEVIDSQDSPIEGGDGNKEFLLNLKWRND